MIRVMSYNVGHYNMGYSSTQGFPPEIQSEKVSQFKQLMMQYRPDFIGVQEESRYMDQAGTEAASSGLYKPAYIFRSGYDACTIRSLYEAEAGSYQKIQFSNGQNFRRGIFRVEGKRLLMISAHPISKTGNSDKRLVQYTELFRHAKESGCDWCIITGDFNTTDQADKTNLKALCDKNKYEMAIGSYLPWVDTFIGRTESQRKHSFDNVLVSPGLRIRTTRVLREWYERLYSDHVPVLCDVEVSG